MSDILLRDIPDDVVNAIDAQASRLGLSRNEYLRRELGQVAQRTASSVTLADLDRLSDAFQDLADTDIMDRAWE